MSINHFWHKIKGQINLDKTVLMYSLVVIIVGFSAFGLGRLSVETNQYNDINKDLNKATAILGDTIEISPVLLGENSVSNSTKNFVSSKNGKMYYPIGCSGANRIKAENQIWFSTGADAEKSGFTLSSLCK